MGTNSGTRGTAEIITRYPEDNDYGKEQSLIPEINNTQIIERVGLND